MSYAQPSPPEAGQLLIGRQGVVHQPEGAIGAAHQLGCRGRIQPVDLGDRRGGCGGLAIRGNQHALQEAMAIKPFAHQGNEQITPLQPAAVRAHPRELLDPMLPAGAPGGQTSAWIGHQGQTPELHQFLQRDL